jgi:hypothetical protein
MDPNETLMQLRAWAAGVLESPQGDREHDAAELFDALDNWIAKGGFLPTDWRAK